MTVAEKGCLMGVSGRMNHAIEPSAGDLLMPDRKRILHSSRKRDIEDACFETVDGGRNGYSKRRTGSDTAGVFKSRLTQSPAQGPFPRDFAAVDSDAGHSSDRSGRLGVFSRGQYFSATGGTRQSTATTAFVLALCTVSAAIFWMTGGHALVQQPVITMQSATAPARPAPVVGARSIYDKAALLPDPVTTSAIPADKSGSARAGYTAPIPRPARIERAGSILMIRPSGG